MISTIRYAGLLYRALNPIYSRNPLSGRGAELHGGRFNPRGVAALYASISPMTALREANQVGTLQPTTLVAYRADISPIFDTRDEAALAAYSMAPNELAANNWRDEMSAFGESRTQEFARRLIGEGYAGLVARSFARGSSSASINVVPWRWSDDLPTKLTVVDDDDRLRAEPI